MLLTKKSKPDNTLEEIKDKRGNHFIDSDARGESITKFYRKNYKKQGEGIDKSINEFLGPVAEHPVVCNAKLTENEKNILE
jgi:5S rRNA maturation endonuclease (ribonuclease M5)